MANTTKRKKELSEQSMAIVDSEMGLNVRKAPSKDAEILKVLKNKEKIAIDEKSDVPDGWKAVSGGGFVVAEYLK